MNQRSISDRTRILACLVEGNSIRATSRMTDVARNTVDKFICDLGAACSEYQDKAFQNLSCKRLQCDEIWSFVGAKERNIPREKKGTGRGDIWTWIAIDADTKLVPCWFVGSRDASAAYHFMHDLAGRLASRVQLTTDGHGPYLRAVEDAFGTEIDYAQLIKIYGPSFNEGPAARYSPAQCMGARKGVVMGKPNYAHVSTSICERQNLTMRMGMRRFTRLTNGFSKKVENHEHAIAIHYMYYNFGRIHQSLRVTPAMEAGVSDHVWSLEEIVALLDVK
jgi:IS1 family transposase